MTRRAKPTITPRVTSVADFARGIEPTWRLYADWLAWPPDAFAFTSMILRQTGCYRYVVANDWLSSRSHTWQADVEECATEWLEHVDARLEASISGKPEPEFQPKLALFGDALKMLRRQSPNLTIESLRSLSSASACEFAQALITLHVIADSASTGLGLIGVEPRPGALYAGIANLLLTAYGSLSTLGKHHGVVLPKLRTPQSGLTLRSLSHNITFHSSEVEVMWRTIPWASIQENSLNALLVPWPDKVDEQCFSAERDDLSAVRYFSYDPAKIPDEEWSGRIDSLVNEIVRLNLTIGRLHLIVFPELALPYEQYRRLLYRLREARLRTTGRLRHVPMVIAGVKREVDGELPNQVHLAAFFADRWYDLSQRKHHRWKLDRNQLRQYRLEGTLATARPWYESTPMSQRRLSFLAPNAWLTLCPLICEDLAQLEPVSELIRGVGPTLLTALLMDGPQIKERWSARYASVFADDPGTAVLTLSSIGMVTRSRQLDVADAPEKDRGVVSLWKDQPSGWRTLEAARNNAVLLSLSSTWETQFTADGRTDYAVSSTFRFEGAREVTVDYSGMQGRGKRREVLNRERMGPDSGWEYFGEWADLRELSAATFTTNALISLRGQMAPQLVSLLRGSASSDRGTGRMSQVTSLIVTSLHSPEVVGVNANSRRAHPATSENHWPTAELRHASQVLEQRFARHQGKTWVGYLRAMAAEAVAELRRRDEAAVRRLRPLAGQAHMKDRVERAVALTILNGIHACVDGKRRLAFTPAPVPSQAKRPKEFEHSMSEMADLLETVEDALQRFA